MTGNERQRRLARQKAERQAARRAQAARIRRQRQVILGAVVAVVAVVGVSAFAAVKLGGSSTTSAKPARQPTPSAQATPAAAPCAYTRPKGAAGPVPRKVQVPTTSGLQHKGTVTVRLATNRGAIVLSLDRTKAPCAVNSFVTLARQHYFDKTSCHRLTTSGIFVLQCGDPTGSGSGGPGYVFPDESLPVNRNTPVNYATGTVAMANAGPNTNGSQFFIVYKDTRFSPNYTIFGRVASGLGVVDAVAKAGSNPVGDGKPKLPITIATTTVSG